MIDRSFGNLARTLRTPDIRLGDIHSELVTMRAGETRRFTDADRSVFTFARSGEWELSIEGEELPARAIAMSTAMGFEKGRSHSFTARSGGELFISSIPQSMGVLQDLPLGLIVVPPDAEPFATILLHAVEAHIADFEAGLGAIDGNVIRRCAEICLIQLVRFARAGLTASPGAPPGLIHDEYLLRAWTAYFASPGRKWTVMALAEAAGLGRTAFAQRFSRAFGAPPLQALTRLRMEQAEELLLQSSAPLIEVAFTVGYNSEAAFVRAFHREFGEPPGKFRSARQSHSSPSRLVGLPSREGL